MKLVNLTPHEINIYDVTGERLILSVPPSGKVARCAQADNQMDSIVVQDGDELMAIPIMASTFGAVDGLPEPSNLMAERRGYIVSRMALDAEADRQRRDIFAPGPAVRDGDGRIIGCRGLSI